MFYDMYKNIVTSESLCLDLILTFIYDVHYYNLSLGTYIHKVN